MCCLLYCTFVPHHRVERQEELIQYFQRMNSSFDKFPRIHQLQELTPLRRMPVYALEKLNVAIAGSAASTSTQMNSSLNDVEHEFCVDVVLWISKMFDTRGFIKSDGFWKLFQQLIFIPHPQQACAWVEDFALDGSRADWWRRRGLDSTWAYPFSFSFFFSFSFSFVHVHFP